ncbi:DNTTIP1-dimer domain-containing protein [Aphelenchoides bicaudatus]|nr:DNTTIP1-dimer domain-containing protein [Aphelenchoides bicaudatus]
MLDYDELFSGNANGNKFNKRIEMLEKLLEATGDGTSAKVNSLRQAINRSKTDMAENLNSSLDLLRQVFQAEMTEEIKQVMDRHIRTTFSPALENLRRNGFQISETDLNELCVGILEAAKEPFLHADVLEQERQNRKIIPSDSVLKPKTHNQSRSNAPNYDSRRIYESEGNESDTSMASFSNTSQFGGDPRFSRPKKRGRPRKTDVDTGRCGSPLMNGTQQVTFAEAFKWNPDRIQGDSRFVLGSKVNKLLALGHRGHIFVKYPRIFRYVGDEDDKSWLFDRNYSTRMSGKVFFMLLDDVMDLATLESALPNIRNELQRCSFMVPEKMLLKMKAYMCKPFEALKSRIAPASPLQINPNAMLSSPASSIVSTEAAMTQMAIQQQENGQDHSMDMSLINNLNGNAAGSGNDINLTSSLMSLLSGSNQQLLGQHNNQNNQLANGLSALNHLQLQNGQHPQQGLLNALAQQQQNTSNGNNSNFSFVQ